LLALQLDGGLGLPNEPRNSFVIECDVIAEDLDRDRHAELEVPALEDEPHAASPEERLDLVLAEQDRAVLVAGALAHANAA